MKQPGRLKLAPLIILAGGKSERFGSPKGLASVDGRSILSAHINSFVGNGSKVVIVIGHITTPYVKEIELLARKLQQTETVAINWVVNPCPENGPFSSLQTGLAEIGDFGAAGVFVLPVDTGVVPTELFTAIAAASDSGRLSVIPEFQGRGGHPVFLGAAMVKPIFDVDPVAGDGRLDVQLRQQKKGMVVRLPVAWSGILENRNTPN